MSLKGSSSFAEQPGVLLCLEPKPVLIGGATEALTGHSIVNGVFEPTGELSGGWPLYRKRGDGDKWIHFWPATKQWIVTNTASKGKDAAGFATIVHEGSLESCAGRPWRMSLKGSSSFVEQRGVILQLDTGQSHISGSFLASALLPSPVHSDLSNHSVSLSSSSQPCLSIQVSSNSTDQSHHMLNTEYRGVISIVSSYTPPHSCFHSMLHDLHAVLPDVVRMDFIARECVTKAESVLQRLPTGTIKLPVDMAVAVAAYTYDLGISSATADGRSDALSLARVCCC